MRPIATDQDFLRNPLDELLGTPANVRLLRLLLDEVNGPVGAPDAAERTGLTEAGARRALKRLVKTGFVRRLGGGRSQTFEFRTSGPISTSLAALFQAERERYRSLLARLRDVIGALPEIRVAWIDEPPLEPGQPLHVGVVADSGALTYLEDQMRQRIIPIEKELDVTIEIHTFSRADMPEVDWQTTTLLGGQPSSVDERPSHSPTHSGQLARARRLSALIAEQLDRDPSLLRRAERHIEFLLKQDQGSAAHDLKEWQEILTHYSEQRIRDFLTSETPRAQRLRQSSPFFAVLDPDQREELLDALDNAP